MIISHSYKFIFVKTEKTAGTSLEIALSKFCGERDIITPITYYDEKTRKELGFRSSQNYASLDPLIKGRNEDRLKILYRCLKQRSAPKQFWNHISAREIRDRVGDDIWDNYYKFTIIRNPYDRAISLYYWKHPTENKYRPHFSTFLREHSTEIQRNWTIVSINDEFALDSFVRYEEVQADLDKISKDIGLPNNVFETMEHIKAKSQFRPKSGLKKEGMQYDQKLLIYLLCRPEFEHFGIDAEIEDPNI